MNTSEKMKGPDFIVVGAAKSGTTTLCEQFATHPEIFVTTPKEPKFFSLDENYTKGLEHYLELYRDGQSAIARGEGSVNYTMRTESPETAKRIHKHYPDCKILFAARHPYDRIISNWQMFKRSNPEAAELNECIKDPNLDHFLADRSRYFYNLEPYLELFPRENIKVIFFEPLTLDPQETLSDCFRFLGVDENWQLPDPKLEANRARDFKPQKTRRKKANFPGSNLLRSLLPSSLRKSLSSQFLEVKDTSATLAKPELSPETKAYLRERLESDIKTFLQTFDKPDDYWAL